MVSNGFNLLYCRFQWTFLGEIKWMALLGSEEIEKTLDEKIFQNFIEKFRVNTMFACWCSEMIYYTCNMKHARWCSIGRSVTYLRQPLRPTIQRAFTLLQKKFSRLCWSFIDIMLYGSFENINKIGRREFSENGFSLGRHDTSIQQHMTRDEIDV